MIASKFLDYLTTEKSELERLAPKGAEYVQKTSFSHGEIIIESFLKINANKRDELDIGVQIQGSQFRLYVCKYSKSNIKCEDLFKEFLDFGWFDKDFNSTNKNVFGNNSTMSAKSSNSNHYNKYETDKYRFVYQHFTISDDNNKFEDITKLIVEYLSKARDVIEKVRLIQK